MPEIMNVNDLRKKVLSEFDEFSNDMKSQTAEQVFENAYQISTKQNFSYYFSNVLENEDLSEKQLNALISSKNCLNELYENWLHNESWGAFEDIPYCLKDTANKIIYSQERENGVLPPDKESPIQSEHKADVEKINPDFYTQNRKNLYIADPMNNKFAKTVMNILDNKGLDYSAVIDTNKNITKISVLNNDVSIGVLTHSINEAQSQAIEKVKENNPHVYNPAFLKGVSKENRYYVRDIKDKRNIARLTYRLDNNSYYVNHNSGVIIVDKSDTKSINIINNFRSQIIKENEKNEQVNAEKVNKVKSPFTMSRNNLKQAAGKVHEQPKPPAPEEKSKENTI